jgi:hypothetical protein
MPQGRARHGLGWQLAMPPSTRLTSITTTTASFDSTNVLLANALFIVPFSSHRGRAGRASEDAPPHPPATYGWSHKRRMLTSARCRARVITVGAWPCRPARTNARGQGGQFWLVPGLALPKAIPFRSRHHVATRARPRGVLLGLLFSFACPYSLPQSPAPDLESALTHRPTSMSTSTCSSPSTTPPPSSTYMTSTHRTPFRLTDLSIHAASRRKPSRTRRGIRHGSLASRSSPAIERMTKRVSATLTRLCLYRPGHQTSTPTLLPLAVT